MSSEGDWHAPNVAVAPTTLVPSDVNATTTRLPDAPETTNCTLPSDGIAVFPLAHDHSLWLTTLCATYMTFGLVCVFFGYRCFKAVMFFSGFVFASIVVYLICMEEEVLPEWATGLVCVCAGLLFGLITLLVQYVGLFMLGFHSGLLLGVAGLCAAYSWPQGWLGAPEDTGLRPASAWVAVAVMLAAGMVMAILNLCFQKSLTIVGSSLYGGAILSTCLDLFVERSRMLLWVWDRVRVAESPQPCWFSWAILAVWPIALVLGVVVQSMVTGKGVHHEKQFPSTARNSHAKPEETREERKQRKYRYLYQVRTCHGDVISQPIPGSYVRQVNEPRPMA